MSRKRFSEREVIETLAWQGIVVPCFRCKKPLYEVMLMLGEETMVSSWDNEPEREHLHEIKFGGPDEPGNCRYSHRVCHAIATNGTKATSAGSSKQRIAKVKRLRHPRKSKHPMKSSGRKITSRPFPKRKAT